jgi:hypothetical protein
MTHANIAFTLHLSRRYSSLTHSVRNGSPARFDEAIEQYHRALSLQPSLSFCGDMLSQALEDLRIYSADTPHQHSSGGGDNFLNSLLHTSSRPTTVAAPGDSSPDMNVSSFLLTPTQQQRHQLSFENSFFIHEDEAMKSGRGTGVGSEEEDEEFSGISDDQHRQEEEEQQREGEEDSFSVESYSRIAGRLSLDSSSGFG